MTTIYLLDENKYNDSTGAVDTEVIAAFATQTSAESEASRLNVESKRQWIDATGGDSDPDNIRTTYSVYEMELRA